MLQKKGLRISEEKISVVYNTGKKTSTKNPVSHSGEVIASLLELIAIKRPLTYLGIPGLILILIGIGFGIWSLSYFNEARFFPIPILVTAFGSSIIGAMLLLMSVVLYGITKQSKRF